MIRKRAEGAAGRPNPWVRNPAPDDGAAPGTPEPPPSRRLPGRSRPARSASPTQGPRIPTYLIPAGAGLIVVVAVAVGLYLLSGGDDKADPAPPPSPTTTASTPTSTYTPPPNAVLVGSGVAVVPAAGWSLLEKETQGKEFVSYAASGDARAFFWVRQKQNVTAKAYVLGIVEGETQNEIAQLGNVRNLTCPKDVLEECVAISYTSTTKDKSGQQVKVQGYVEAYRRKDQVVTALDFRTRIDFAPQAEADAATMKQSVLDSL